MLVAKVLSVSVVPCAVFLDTTEPDLATMTLQSSVAFYRIQ